MNSKLSRFVVSKSRKKKDKIALKRQPESADIFLISACKHMLWILIRGASQRPMNTVCKGLYTPFSTS